jgi:hypothetical protein
MTATWNAYRDVGRAVAAMPGLAITAFIIGATISIINVSLVHRIVPASSLYGRDIMGLLGTLLVTPILIAVHRFIILGEVTQRYELKLRDPHLQIFFGWSSVVYVTLSVLAPLGGISVSRFGPPGLAIVAVAIGIWIIFLRMTILFPAIAVGAPGATVLNTIADTKSHGWYIAGVLTLPFIPLVVAILMVLRARVVMPSLFMSVLTLIVVGVGVTLSKFLAVAVASRLYLALGNRINQPSSNS